MREADGGGDERGGAGIIRHREDEGTVELQLIDRKLAQVGERAVSGAEIVHGDLNAVVAQAAQDETRLIAVGHQGLFGDLQLKCAGRQAA